MGKIGVADETPVSQSSDPAPPSSGFSFLGATESTTPQRTSITGSGFNFMTTAGDDGDVRVLYYNKFSIPNLHNPLLI